MTVVLIQEQQLKPNDWPTISIVVPVRNESDFIAQTLDMLLAQDYPAGAYEILVVDGQSTDDTPAIVKTFIDEGAPVRLVNNPQRWSSAARNLGVRHAVGEIVLVIDGHCELPDQQHFRHVAQAFRTSGADIIGRPQPLTVHHSTRLQAAIATARASRLGHHPDSYIYSSENRFVPAQSVGAAYKREVFQSIGYFDEQFDACEDVDFNHRADRAGLTCYLSTESRVHYFPRRSLGTLFDQLARYGQGRVRLARKHPETLSWKSMAPAVFLAGLLILALAALVWAPARWALAAVGLIYLGVVVAISAWITLTHRTGWSGGWLPAVFVVIHFGAGWGALKEWISGFFRRSSPPPSSMTAAPPSARSER